MKGHSWTDKLAWVGMTWEFYVAPGKDAHADVLATLYNVVVRVRIPQGRVAYGGGNYLEPALQDAAERFDIDWYSVGRKMTEAAWAEIAHC
jgi:hypothetical protein